MLFQCVVEHLVIQEHAVRSSHNRWGGELNHFFYASLQQSMPDSLLVSLPQIWFDNLQQELQRRLQRQRLPAQIQAHRPGKPLSPRAQVFWLWYDDDFQGQTKPSGLKIQHKSAFTPPTQISQLPAQQQVWLRRLKRLHKQLLERKPDSDFLKFCGSSVGYFRKAEKHWQQNQVLQSLAPKVEPFEGLYFDALGQALDEAILRATGITTMEEVVRTLVKVLVIDGMGGLVPENLQARGYRSPRISTMSLFQLRQLWQKQQPEIAEIDVHALSPAVFQQPEFEKFDLILVNPWKFKDDGLPVAVFARTSGNLSRKEEQQASQHFENQRKLEELKGRRQRHETQLNAVVQQLQLIENTGRTQSRGDEQHYRQLLGDRKKLTLQLRRDTLRIKELSKQVDTRPRENLDVVNLLEAFQTTGSFANRAATLLKSSFTSPKDDPHSPQAQLKRMSVFMRQRERIEATMHQLHGEMQTYEDKLQQWTDHRFRGADQRPWRRPFLEHLLDLLEVAALREMLAQTLPPDA